MKHSKTRLKTDLRCKSVTFWSPGDELHFFQWLKSIPGVIRWEGVLDEIHIFVRKRLSERSKLELWGLFKRYRVETVQLKKLKLLPACLENGKEA